MGAMTSPKRTVSARGGGGLATFRAVMEAHGPLLRGLSAADVKMIAQSAILAASSWWVDNYLHLRFTGYARSKLGYDLQSGHAKRKKRYQATDPLVWTGELRLAVLEGTRIRGGGSAANPWAKITWRYPHAYAKIIYQVLGTILQDELGVGAAAEFERVYLDLLQGVTITKRTRTGGVARGGARVTVATRLDSALAEQSRSRYQAAQERKEMLVNDARDFAMDVDIRREEGHAAAQAALKRTHDRWRRTSGGSAPVGGRDTPARSYLRSSRYRHAQAQARLRAKRYTRNR